MQKRDQKWWDEFFMAQAEHMATASKDPSTKAGAVIYDTHRRPLGNGYNGFPRGVLDTEDRLNNRDVKYLMIQHAESNAIDNSTTSLDGSTIYATHFPCAQCAGRIIQKGIKRVVTKKPSEDFISRWETSISISLDMFKESGVEVVLLNCTK